MVVEAAESKPDRSRLLEPVALVKVSAPKAVAPEILRLAPLMKPEAERLVEETPWSMEAPELARKVAATPARVEVPETVRPPERIEAPLILSDPPLM